MAEVEAWFGPEKGPKDILVNLIKPTDAFRTLHDELCDGMESLGAQHAEPAYVGNGFHAHVSRQKEGQFTEGSHHTATATYLVETLESSLLACKRIVERTIHRG